MECPNCHHQNERTAEPTNGNSTSAKNEFLFLIIVLLLTSIFMFVTCYSIYMYDYHVVLPRTRARFSTVAFAASGLNANATSYPVLHVAFHFESTLGSKNTVCLHRRSASVSYSGILLANTTDHDSLLVLDESSEQMLCSMKGHDNEFVTKLVGAAISMPSNFNEESAVFDVEMKLDGMNTDFVSQTYQVFCKNVMLKAMDAPVLCDTTMLVQTIGKEKQY